jgi:Protein of unknown function (DUF1353)
MRQLFFHLVLLLIISNPTASQTLGKFVGTVQAEWLADGRQMRLLADFAYVDSRGLRWLAPKGSLVDGASIPRVFWTSIGGPFEGKYRLASVVHDVACREKKQTWRAVHRMFYNASRLAGVDPVQARIMYGAVFHFGPRWGERAPRELETQEDFERMRVVIERKPQLGLSEIEDLSREQLEQQVPVPPPPTRPPPRN